MDKQTHAYMPMIVERTNKGERAWDLYSRLLKDRIILLNGPIDDDVAGVITAALLFLESEDPEQDISMYINSPGGVVTSGLGILDTMWYLKCPISTICIGQCASMGAVLLAAGDKGKRMATPFSRIMIHQPLGGASGQATDIEIRSKEIQRLKKILIDILADCCGKTGDADRAQVEKDMDRDFFLSAKEAVEYGLIDAVLTHRKK